MMENFENEFSEQVNELIKKYGKLKYFEKALEKQKVTRHLIIHSKYINMYETMFFYLISVGVLLLGIAGLVDIKPKELSFLIPIGLVMLFAVQRHSRKVKKALNELSDLAVGIHARKLADE